MTTTGAPANLADLGRWVRQARLEHGWSKVEAARHATVSPITWRRVEHGLPVQEPKLALITRALVEPDETIVAAPVSPGAARTRCKLESIEFNDDGSTTLQFRSWDIDASWSFGEYAISPFIAASDSPPGAVGLGLVPPGPNPTETGAE